MDVELVRDPGTYNPRACDCDFCRKHGAAYVSDPQGSLVIRVRDAGSTGNYRQGSGLADCLICRNCGVLAGALFREDGRVYGALNVKIVDAGTSFGAEQTASPKSLSASQKTRRWQDIWFSKVTIEAADH